MNDQGLFRKSYYLEIFFYVNANRESSDDDDEDRHSKYRDGGEEGHGRKKYVGFSQNFQLLMLMVLYAT